MESNNNTTTRGGEIAKKKGWWKKNLHERVLGKMSGAAARTGVLNKKE